MAILITGSKGFIGSKLLQKLEYPVVHTIDLKNGQNLLTCDLPEDVDVIYHLAAQTSVEASWHDPVNDAHNYLMMARLVHNYPNARIIYANSAAAIPPISSPYGLSKHACAEYLTHFHHDYVVCTFPNVYGPGSKSVVDRFKGADMVTIYGDGSHIRDYVHVYDIVQGLLRARNWGVGEYQMGSGIGTAVKDLVKPGQQVVYAPERQEAVESILRNDTPDWQPTINIHDYLS